VNPVALTLIIAFVVLVGMTALAFLAGFLKGLLKTSIKTVLKFVLTLVWIFTTPAITAWVGTIDLSRWNLYYSANGTRYLLTTLIEMLATFITSTGLLSPMNSVTLYSTAVSVAELILSYAVFLVLMLLTQLFISLTTALVYNGIFRWFAPVESSKENRERKKQFRKKAPAKNGKKLMKGLVDANGMVPSEEKKRFPLLRAGGSLLGAAQEYLFVLTLLSPVVGLGRIASLHQDDIRQALAIAGADSSTRENFDQAVKAYDESFVPKIYTLGSTTYDQIVMDEVSKTTLNGTEVSLSRLVSSSLDVARPLLASNALHYDAGAATLTVNYAILLDTTTIDSLVSSVLANKTVVSLIPPLVDLALANVSSSTGLAFDSLDLSNLNWSSDIEAIRQFYDLVYDKTLKTIVDGEKITPKNFYMKTSTYTDNQIQTLSRALEVLGSTTFIHQFMPVLLSGMSSFLAVNGFEVLPTKASDYEDIDWSSTFYGLGQILFTLLRVLGIDLSADMNPGEITTKLWDALYDDQKRANVERILVGYESPSFPSSVHVDKSLFDLDFVRKIRFGTLLENGTEAASTSSALTKYTSRTEFREALRNLDGKSVETVKKEIETAFSVIDILRTKGNPVYLERDTDWSIIQQLTDPICKELKEVLEASEESTIFNSLYPILLKTFLIQNYKTNDIVKNALFGLTPYDFEYDDPNFTADLASFLGLLPSLKRMFDALGDDGRTRQEKILALDAGTLGQFLALIASSGLFNPQAALYSKDTKMANVNLHTVLSSVFSSEPFSSLGLKVPTVEEMSGIAWGDDSTGEISVFVKLLEDIQKNSAFFSEDFSSFSLDQLSKVEDREAFFDLAEDFTESRLLYTTGLRAALDKVDAYLKKKNFPFSLEDLRSYALDDSNRKKIQEDIERYKSLLPLINKLSLKSILHDSKHYFRQIETDDLNAILTSVLHSNFYDDLSKAGKPDLIASLIHALAAQKGFFKGSFPDYGSGLFDPKALGVSWIETTGSKTLIGKTQQGESQSLTATLTTGGSLYDLLVLFDFAKEQVYPSAWKEGDFSSFHPISFLTKDESMPLFSSVYLRRLFVVYSPSFLKWFKEKIPSLPNSLFVGLSKMDLDLIDSADALSATELKDSVLHLFTALKPFFKKDEDGKYYYQKTSNLSTFLSLPEDVQASLEEGIEAIGKSKLLTARRKGEDQSPLSYFAFKALGKSKELLKAVTCSTTTESGEKVARTILAQIDESEAWESETKLYRAIDRLFVQAKLPLDFSSLDPYSLPVDNPETLLSTLFSDLNQSLLLHRLPISLLQSKAGAMNLDAYLHGEDGIVPYPIDFQVHLDPSQSEDVAFWEKTEQGFVRFLYDKKDGSYLNAGLVQNGLSGFDGENAPSARLLYYFATMPLLEKQVPYLLKNLIGDNADLLHAPKSVPYGESAGAVRLQEIFFENSSLEKNQALDETLALSDLSHVDQTLNLALKAAKKVSDSNDLTTLSGELGEHFFENLASAAEGSDLASEFVTGVLTRIQKKYKAQLALYDALNSTHYSTEDFYGYDESLTTSSHCTYPYVHPDQAAKIDTMLKAVSLLPRH